MDGSDQPTNASTARDALGRFAPGNPGRPFGTRNRVSARVVRTVLRDFEANQGELLAKLRRWYVPQYVAMVSRLLPRNGEGEVAEAAPLSLADLRAALDQVEARGGTMADLEAMVADGASDGAGADIIGE